METEAQRERRKNPAKVAMMISMAFQEGKKAQAAGEWNKAVEHYSVILKYENDPQIWGQIHRCAMECAISRYRETMELAMP